MFKKRKAKKMKKLFGTSGLTYDAWKGKFYPKKLAKNKWFEYYTGRFHWVEINATYYKEFANIILKLPKQKVKTMLKRFIFINKPILNHI
jgi:uncharacterized protein YecE (DUF72 family)